MLRNAALAAQQALGTADVTLKTKGDENTEAFNALTDMMRSLILILGASLDGDDPRWLAFGLQMPATATTPGKPVNVTASLDAMGNLVIQCDATPLGTRWRFRGLVVGVETKYRLLASSTAPLASVADAALPGQRLQIVVQAVNGDRQGVASDPIVFTMPLLEKASATQPAPEAEPAIKDAAAASGNGGNGRANGRRLPALA